MARLWSRTFASQNLRELLVHNECIRAQARVHYACMTLLQNSHTAHDPVSFAYSSKLRVAEPLAVTDACISSNIHSCTSGHSDVIWRTTRQQAHLCMCGYTYMHAWEHVRRIIEYPNVKRNEFAAGLLFFKPTLFY